MTATTGPVFVYGALRSGTTLLRLMLKRHSGLHSPGEADFLFDHLSGDLARVDRTALAADRIFRAKEIALPEGVDGPDLIHALTQAMAGKDDGRLFVSVHRHAGRMAALFPDAPVIHLLRDPRDVARSSIGMGWTGTSYHGVGHWIGTERDWDAARIDPARVLTLTFEDLMSDLEGELTRVCGHLGLPFEADMLNYHENSTYAPPDPKIAGKWRKGASAREIALIEGRLGTLLEARGYAPAGRPATPGPVEAWRLAATNRLRRWRYNARRYGPALFLGHHAARALGLRDLEHRLAARQEAIRIRNLQ